MIEDGNMASDMPSEPEKQLSDWLLAAIKHADMTQADLSRALILAGLRTIDRSAVNKMCLGTRKVSGEEMLEISRITSYPLPDRRIGASKIRREEMTPAQEFPREHRVYKQHHASEQSIPNTQREAHLFALVAKVLEAQGMTPAAAERLVAAIGRVSDMPRDGEMGPDQIEREARILAALFDPKHPL